MRVTSTLASAALLLAHVTGTAATCKKPSIVRKEWRSLSKSQRLGFIDAIKCMQSKPSQASAIYTGSRSRYDDYQGLHIGQTDYVHFDAQFYPWHRMLLHLFETDLANLCGWTQGIPYWDWSLDAGNMLASPVFDTTYGFGGNGPWVADLSNFTDVLMTTLPDRTGGGCITDGPFWNRTVNMGPGNITTYNPHCLRRDFSPVTFSSHVNCSVVEETLGAEDYWHLNQEVQGFGLQEDTMRTHAGGHLGVGGMVGEMSDMYSSPGDPLFYLHHSQLDRIWNMWQRMDWDTRKTDIGGPDTMWAYPFNFFGDVPYTNITLATPLYYPGIASTVNVSVTMDVMGGPFCYGYM